MMVWDIRHAAAPLIQARLHDEPGMSESDFMQFLGFVFCILMTLKNQPFKVWHFEHIYMLSMIHEPLGFMVFKSAAHGRKDMLLSHTCHL
jgi:hypothetical protein